MTVNAQNQTSASKPPAADTTAVSSAADNHTSATHDSRAGMSCFNEVYGSREGWNLKRNETENTVNQFVGHLEIVSGAPKNTSTSESFGFADGFDIVMDSSERTGGLPFVESGRTTCNHAKPEKDS